MEAKVLVSVDVTKPLKFKKKILTASGEEIVVYLIYEKLHRYCYSCFMISHEKRDCPQLTDHQRQANRKNRVAPIPVEHRRREEYREGSCRRLDEHWRPSLNQDEVREGSRTRHNRSVDEPARDREIEIKENRSDEGAHRCPVRRSLYHTNELARREVRNPVLQCLVRKEIKTFP